MTQQQDGIITNIFENACSKVVVWWGVKGIILIHNNNNNKT